MKKMIEREVNVGDELEYMKNINSSLVLIVGNRKCLLKKISEQEAEVLYRETKDENQPSISDMLR